MLDQNFYSKYLSESTLELYLTEIFKVPFIKDKAFGKDCRFRPDYRNDDLKLIIEFDGFLHYTDAKTVLNDEYKDKLYESFGYEVIRIPYFIQLSIPVIKNLFNVEVTEGCTFKQGFIENRIVLPCNFCQIGIEKFKRDLEKFNYIKAEILESLRKRPEFKKDLRLVIPNSIKI